MPMVKAAVRSGSATRRLDSEARKPATESPIASMDSTMFD
jgi:hypothetical protein